MDFIDWLLIIGWFFEDLSHPTPPTETRHRQLHAPSSDLQAPGIPQSLQSYHGTHWDKIAKRSTVEMQVVNLSRERVWRAGHLETWKPDVEDVEDVWKRPRAFSGRPLAFETCRLSSMIGWEGWWIMDGVFENWKRIGSDRFASRASLVELIIWRPSLLLFLLG